jgi:hypothetical protein
VRVCHENDKEEMESTRVKNRTVFGITHDNRTFLYQYHQPPEYKLHVDIVNSSSYFLFSYNRCGDDCYNSSKNLFKF